MEAKKNPKANLEKYRLSLFLFGLCTAASISLAAIEYSSLDAVAEPLDKENDDVDDMVFEIEIPDEPEPDEPEPEPLPPPPDDQVNMDEIEEVEDEEDETEFVNVPDAPPPPPPPPPVKKEVEILEFPQQLAEYPGGEQALYEYLAKNIVYPRMAREAQIQGKVFIEFVVWSDGSISQIKALNKIGGGCEQEAIRVIQSMPKWAPAEQAGKKVNSKFLLPVVFKLSD